MESANHPEAGELWWRKDIGYAKVGGKWGIALRSCAGDETNPNKDDEETWLFNEAPRRMRVLGIGYIPKLIDRMVVEINETADSIKKKTCDAKELADAVRLELTFASKQK